MGVRRIFWEPLVDCSCLAGCVWSSYLADGELTFFPEVDPAGGMLAEERLQFIRRAHICFSVCHARWRGHFPVILAPKRQRTVGLACPATGQRRSVLGFGKLRTNG